jgi:hypothetical protein
MFKKAEDWFRNRLFIIIRNPGQAGKTAVIVSKIGSQPYKL